MEPGLATSSVYRYCFDTPESTKNKLYAVVYEMVKWCTRVLFNRLTQIQLCLVGFGLFPQLELIVLQLIGGIARTQLNELYCTRNDAILLRSTTPKESLVY